MKNLIFDLDGTIIDSLYIWEQLAYEYIKGLGYKVDRDISREIETMNLEEASRYLREKFSLNKTEEEIRDELKDLIKKYYEEKFQAKEGLIDFVKKSYRAGYNLVVGTTIEEDLAGIILKRLGIDRYFKRIFTEENLKLSKRDSLYYEKILEFMDFKPEDSILFEDSLYALESAKKVGLKLVLIRDTYHEKDFARASSLADLVIENFTDLEEI